MRATIHTHTGPLLFSAKQPSCFWSTVLEKRSLALVRSYVHHSDFYVQAGNWYSQELPSSDKERANSETSSEALLCMKL